MPEASGQGEIVHLGWRANGDGFDVALAVNRLLSCGARAWWIHRSHDGVDAGDYLVEVTHAQRLGLARMGVSIAPWHAEVPSDARLLWRPVVRLFAGTASKFPYFAYYALCLLRLGIDYVGCDGASLAHGALADANLLIIPGGFATWGIDRAENASGADERVRDFLARGGAAIGSCGGAYYLSAGRPGWTGTAPAKPLYTHEYLQSGVGVVSVAMCPGPLSFGCSPTMEMPYYHGPIYDLLGSGIEVAAKFHALALPGRLAIDNPLDREAFERDIAGKPAILMAAGDRGRAVLFSPHPEMGDLVRRYIALDGYVRRYLPIRGFGTMRDTLRHYRVTDAPSFRLVLNAVHALMTGTHAPHNPSPVRGIEAEAERMASYERTDAFPALCRRGLAELPDFGGGEEGDLLRDVAAGIAARLDAASARAAKFMEREEPTPSLEPSRRHLVYAMTEHWKESANRTAAQQLMEADLGVALLECWTRAAEFDQAIAGT